MDEGPVRDPEFRPAPPAARVLRDEAGALEPEAYQRLVANPFLAFAAWVFWLPASYWVMAWLTRPERIERVHREGLLALANVAVILLLAAGFLAPIWLFQFHCLDCGRTSLLSRWRRHACPAILGRRALDRPRRFRGPTPPVQVVLWLWALLAAGMAMNCIRS